MTPTRRKPDHATATRFSSGAASGNSLSASRLSRSGGGQNDLPTECPFSTPAKASAARARGNLFWICGLTFPATTSFAISASGVWPSASTAYRVARTPSSFAFSCDGSVNVETRTPPFQQLPGTFARFAIDQVEHEIEVGCRILEALLLVVDNHIGSERGANSTFSVETVVSTRAPLALANCTAKCPTPLQTRHGSIPIWSCLKIAMPEIVLAKRSVPPVESRAACS